MSAVEDVNRFAVDAGLTYHELTQVIAYLTEYADQIRPVYTATFQPQVWVNDQAVDAGPATTWDCTDQLAKMPEDYRDMLLTELEENQIVVDRDDWLMLDPESPREIRNHLRGEPYTGYVTIEIEEEY